MLIGKAIMLCCASRMLTVRAIIMMFASSIWIVAIIIKSCKWNVLWVIIMAYEWSMPIMRAIIIHHWQALEMMVPCRLCFHVFICTHFALSLCIDRWCFHNVYLRSYDVFALYRNNKDVQHLCDPWGFLPFRTLLIPMNFGISDECK